MNKDDFESLKRGMKQVAALRAGAAARYTAADMNTVSDNPELSAEEIAAETVLPTRPEIVRQLLESGLKSDKDRR